MIYVHLHFHTAMVVGGSATRQPPRRSPHVPVVSRRDAISPSLVAEDARVARRDDASRDCVPLPLFPFLSFPFLSFPFLSSSLSSSPPPRTAERIFPPPLSLSPPSLSRVSPFLRLASLSGGYGHYLSLALSLSLFVPCSASPRRAAFYSRFCLSLSLSLSLSLCLFPSSASPRRAARSRPAARSRTR